jgi:putative transposase
VTHTDYQHPVQMFRAYKFLLRPTSKQVTALEACLEDTRQLYNAALEERREAWRMGHRQVTFYSQDAQLQEIRLADPNGVGRWAFACERAAIRRLDWAFAAFFRRIKAGERSGYPRFKSRGRFDSLEWAAVKAGACWDSVPHPTVTRVRFLGIGHVRVHQHRTVKGRVKTITAKREGNRWYVILACDDVPAEPLPATGAVVGIDMGVTHFLSTSTGKHVPNPRYGAATADKLAAAQQSLAGFPQRRAQDRTRKHRVAAMKVSRLHTKIRRQRLDHAHKTALRLVRENDVVAHEALQVTNMTRRPRPRPAEDGSWEPNGAAAKSGLNRSILDAGWGVFLRVLAEKAEEAARMIIAVNPAFTSQRCARCGHIAEENRDGGAFCCLGCGHEAHADVNAAINILRAGLALQAAEAA